MVNDSSTKFPSMDAARNTRSTVKKLSSREQRIQTSPVKVDIEKGSVRIATETSNLETFPLPASILEFACIHSFPSLPFSFLSPRGKKKLAPLSSLSSNAYKTASPQERCSLERRIFDGGREVAGEVLFVRNSRFVPSCQREHFFFFFSSFSYWPCFFNIPGYTRASWNNPHFRTPTGARSPTRREEGTEQSSRLFLFHGRLL